MHPLVSEFTRSCPEDREPSSALLTYHSQSETVSDIALSYHMGAPFSAGLNAPAIHFSARRVPAKLTKRITHVERGSIDRPRPVDRDVECIRWLAKSLALARTIECRHLRCSRAILSQRPSLTLHPRTANFIECERKTLRKSKRPTEHLDAIACWSIVS